MTSSYLSRSPQKQIERQSRLISQQYYSRNKMSSSLPPIQRPMYTDVNFYKNDPLQIQKASHQQYELIIQFELKRQKEKTKILEERLKNKQIFIKQMKELQDQLAIAYEKCQKQLMQHKSQIQQFQTFNKNKPAIDPFDKKDKQIRQYLQEIAQLKHLVIRLEQQIINYEIKQKQHHWKLQIQKNNSQVNQNHFSSMKNQFIQGSYSPSKSKKVQVESHKKVRQARSKTMMNQANSSLQQHDKILKQIKKQPLKISSFISHFLTMVDFFNRHPNNSVSPFSNPILNEKQFNSDLMKKNNSLNHQLKIAWRWIKAVVVEWNQLKTKKIQQTKQFKLGNHIRCLLPCLNSHEIELYVTSIIQSELKKGRKIAKQQN